MKKLFLLSLVGMMSFLTACSGQYIHSTEPRSVVYMGQPAADVYENFGAPTRIKKLRPNAQVLIYQKQEIEKDWAYRYFHSCEIQFYMVDDRVSDWYSTGDMCAIRSNRYSEVDWDGQDDGLLSFFTESPLYKDVPESDGYYMDSRVPADAFGGAGKSVFTSPNTFVTEDGFSPFEENGYVTNNETVYGYVGDDGVFDAPRKQLIGGHLIPADAF